MLKKLACAAMLILLISVSIFAGDSHAVKSTEILKKGMSGAEVIEIQSSLTKLGYFDIEPTGYFGHVTEYAVRKLQQDQGLTDDGIAGAVTRSRIQALLNNNYLSCNKMLRKGMTGTEVNKLQKSLKKLGYFNIETTDYYGHITESAVKEFQKLHGLIPDGIAGMNTCQKINMLLGKPLLKKGMSGAEVTALQNDLQILKVFSFEPTGYFGQITEASIKAFQGQNGLAVSGIADLPTYIKIDSLLSRLKIVVIDPGHGGIDIGTSRGNVLESRVNLDISIKLKEYLSEKGYGVILTRNRDMALDHLSDIPENRERRDLNARTNIINLSPAKLFVSIHVDSLPGSPSVSGSIVYYNSNISGSKTLAKNIQRELNNISAGNSKRPSWNSREGDFYVLNNSKKTGVLIETAYITNDNEYSLLKTDAFKEKIARAILQGIENTGL